MKSYVLICLLLLVSACGSHKRSGRVDYTGDLQSTAKSVSEERFRSQTITGVTSTTALNIDVSEKIKRTYFDSSGNIAVVEEIERNTIADRLDSTSQKQSANSIGEKSDSIATFGYYLSKIEENTKTETDSRLVQDEEVLYAAVALLVTCLLVYSLTRIRKRKK